MYFGTLWRDYNEIAPPTLFWNKKRQNPVEIQCLKYYRRFKNQNLFETFGPETNITGPSFEEIRKAGFRTYAT